MEGNIKLAVGLSGYAGAGKDTFADALVETGDFEKISFAQPVWEFILELDPIIPIEVKLFGWRVFTYHTRLSKLIAKLNKQFSHNESRVYSEAKKNPYVRVMLQKLGTEFGRKNFGDKCWVNIAIQKAMEVISRGKIPIFTNLRYQSEYHEFRRLFSNPPYRSFHVHIIREGVGPINSHSSEQYIEVLENNCNVTVNNHYENIRDFHGFARDFFNKESLLRAVKFNP